MTFNIHKGKHRASPLYWLKWWPFLFNPSGVHRRVMFDPSAKYNLNSSDQADHNKLFGVGFGGVHRNSARFGWRFDNGTERFILSAYCYVNGERSMVDLCQVVALHWYGCHIGITDTFYNFWVTNEIGEWVGSQHLTRGQNKKMGYLLGLYFGGNQVAPHDMSIQIEKI